MIICHAPQWTDIVSNLVSMLPGGGGISQIVLFNVLRSDQPDGMIGVYLPTAEYYSNSSPKQSN